MAGGGLLKREVVPFTALVAMECAIVGINTLYKAATLRGMSYHVFMFYDYAVASLLLLPAPFFSLRSTVLPPLTLSILCEIGLLGLVGGSSQILAYKGINYSSPTLASAMSNLTPAFTFILAIIFRLEKFSFTKASSQAKVLGTVVSIVGASIVTLFRGPTIIILSSSPSISLNQHLHSSDSNRWVIGGILLTAQNILLPLWYILLAKIMEKYPAELTVVFFYNLCVCFMTAIIGLLTERNSSTWRLRPDIALASILCSGLFSSVINNAIHSWALRIKGPVYLAMFKPFSIALAVAMGVMFLGDTLYIGSAIGAIMISLGFYTLTWGKAKEERAENYRVDCGLDSLPSSWGKHAKSELPASPVKV